MNERRLDSLTSVRFLACLHVVLYHLSLGLLGGVPLLDNVLRLGYLGVSFFFVLSGFILVAVYASRGKAVDPRKFYVARFARIYPIYAVALVASTLSFVSELHKHGEPLGHAALPIVLRLTMLSAWVPGLAAVLNAPAWTLSVETFFYATFPVALALMLRSKPAPRRWAILVVTLLGALTPYLLHRAYPVEDLRSPFNAALFFPLFHLGSFLVGCEAGLWYLHRDTRTPRGHRALSWGLGLSLAVTVFVVAFQRAFPIQALHNGFFALPFAAVILWLAENDARLALLRLPFLVVLGEASYGAYILQDPVHALSLAVAHKIHVPEPSQNLGSLLAYLLALVGISVFCHYKVEVPARRWLRARLEPKGSPESRILGAGIEAEALEGR